MRHGGSSMTRCNGFCSGGRAMRAIGTLDGRAALSAERERPWCGVSANTAARSTSTPFQGLKRSPNGTSTEIAKRTTQTWTFVERTKASDALRHLLQRARRLAKPTRAVCRTTIWFTTAEIFDEQAQ